MEPTLKVARTVQERHEDQDASQHRQAMEVKPAHSKDAGDGASCGVNLGNDTEDRELVSNHVNRGKEEAPHSPCCDFHFSLTFRNFNNLTTLPGKTNKQKQPTNPIFLVLSSISNEIAQMASECGSIPFSV